MRMKICGVIILLVSIILSALAFTTQDETTAAVEDCVTLCPFQNASLRLPDGDCQSTKCYQAECARGCGSWRAALQSNCTDVCNGTLDLLPPREFYCTMGCTYALNKYFQALRDQLGTPTTPALVADSLNATSLSLEWGPPPILRLPGSDRPVFPLYRLQWRYEQVHGATWQYCLNHSWTPATFANLSRLQPYTQYQFRVAALVSLHPTAAQAVTFSTPSVVVSTLPQGRPAFPPSRVRVAAVDPTHVSVSWAPPPFPRGPILSYQLHLNELHQAGNSLPAYSFFKDIPVVKSSSMYSYMFQSLPPGRNFTLSVSTRNLVGTGPETSVHISTPPLNNVSQDDQEATLLVASLRSVILLTSDLYGDLKVLYTTQHDIRGMAVHIHQDLVFLSDSTSRVLRFSLTALQNASSATSVRPMVILDGASTGFRPRELSVDWLNNLLYVVGEAHTDQGSRWRIVRCNLEGGAQTVAVAGLHMWPKYLQVDPYNGYMFWISEGRGRGGLYRLDLAEVSNGVRHETRPELILESAQLGAFTVDHANFRLLVALNKNNTVLAVSLDGKETSDIRTRTQSSMFNDTRSLVTARGIFHWINGHEVWGEEYHVDTKSYFHNMYPMQASSQDYESSVSSKYHTLAMLLPATQPVPVPVNPPSALQAVLGHKSAKILWQAPHLLGGQGKGAWQNWSYEVQLRNEDSGEELHTREVGGTSLFFAPLAPNTRYALKACAYTSAGRGPWSTEFRGKSFKAPRSEVREASIIWGAAEGLLETDTTGDNLHTLIHAESLKEIGASLQITGVAWFEDLLYLSTNSSHTLWFNQTSRELGHVPDVDSAGSVAVDWVGRKLYWSNPKQQLITRGGLNGERQEALPILTVAKELHTDSLGGFLYWSTGRDVECAHLNGHNKHTYYPATLFSGKQVMGLTLDTDHGFLFWIVRSYEGSLLHRAPLARDGVLLSPQSTGVIGEVITSFMHPVVQGPLCYYSDHLLWLQDATNAVITDMGGQGAAVISGPGLSGLAALKVLEPADPELRFRDGRQINVIPETINPNSVRLIGPWNECNVTWAPVTNVNWGRVFYEVKILEPHSSHEVLIETSETSVRYPRVVQAYTILNISIRPFTYWGRSIFSSRPVSLRTPVSAPSAPANPREFVTFTRSAPILDAREDIIVQLRWDSPPAPNGIVESYRLRVWQELNESDYRQVITSPDTLEVTFDDLLSYTSYYFEVWARTSAGEGPGSDRKWFITSSESPVPRLLVGTRETLSLTDCDLLPRHHSTVPDRSVSPVVRGEPLAMVTYLAAEKKLFWLSHDRLDIFSCSVQYSGSCSGVVKVASLNGPGSGLTMDWISRTLYWTEGHSSSAEESGTLLWRLNMLQDKKERLITRSRAVISGLQVSPLTSSLFWVEETSKGEGQLMTSQTDGTEVRPFFSLDTSCSCPDYLAVVGTALALDAAREKILWSDAYGDIVSAKLDGCHCETVVNSSAQPGVPVVSITTDHERVYWSGGRDWRIFSAPREYDDDELASFRRQPDRELQVVALPFSGVRFLAALGSHLQPFPEPECLKPSAIEPEDLIATLESSSAYSLTLQLPSGGSRSSQDLLDDDVGCDKVSLPIPKFRVHYGLSPICDGEGELNMCTKENLPACDRVDTYDQVVELSGLAPYSCYVTYLSMGNLYTERQKDEVLQRVVGDPVIFRTQSGAPSPARNISVHLLSPWSARVSWVQPSRFNGPALRYVVAWSTGDDGSNEDMYLQSAIRGVKPVGLEPVPDSSQSNDQGVISSILENLMPAHTYSVWVRACPQGVPLELADCSNSAQVELETMPEPRDIEMLDRTPYNLNMSWFRTPTHGHGEDANVISKVQIIQVTGNAGNQVNWRDVPETFQGSGVFMAHNLFPKTTYQFRINLRYPGAQKPFTWPPDNRFTFETLGDRPSAPGTPRVEHLRPNIYQIIWEVSRDHGAPIVMYYLEGRMGALSPVSAAQLQVRNAREAHGNVSSPPLPYLAQEYPEDWRLIYNGTENHWIIPTDLIPTDKFSFRVRAENSYGLGPWSSPSEMFDWNAEQMKPTFTWTSLAFGVSTFVLFALLICLIYLCVCNSRKKKSPSLSGGSRPEVELANLRDTPRGLGGLPVLHTTNELYIARDGGDLGGNPEDLLLGGDQELAALPHIPREHIVKTKLLGSGAFGEVFEGQATIQLSEGPQAVAIKTLRKNASEQEKAEFLKEAKLMANFKHEHILQLLGVCLNDDAPLIVMELMEGGDLLSHLRASRRAPLANLGELTLEQLVSICLDVARGCRYLEEMHFVHRDLACRNCLVSHVNGRRVVKIGDFGLARDIYKSDYYRKEGEGLLPVRWMAPESLVDGIFTTQSDVWAFGVLMWEILTLGQQPYQARTNIEVLHFVKNGGTLTRPFNCPDLIYQLLVQCWSYNPDARPSFKHCLEVLEDLKAEMDQQNASLALSMVEFTSRFGIINPGFYADDDLTGLSTFQDHLNSDSFLPAGVTVSLPPESYVPMEPSTPSPKYLEVLRDEPLESGYEVPKKLLDLSELRPRASSLGSACEEERAFYRRIRSDSHIVW